MASDAPFPIVPSEPVVGQIRSREAVGGLIDDSASKRPRNEAKTGTIASVADEKLLNVSSSAPRHADLAEEGDDDVEIVEQVGEKDFIPGEKGFIFGFVAHPVSSESSAALKSSSFAPEVTHVALSMDEAIAMAIPVEVWRELVEEAKAEPASAGAGGGGYDDGEEHAASFTPNHEDDDEEGQDDDNMHASASASASASAHPRARPRARAAAGPGARAPTLVTASASAGAGACAPPAIHDALCSCEMNLPPRPHPFRGAIVKGVKPLIPCSHGCGFDIKWGNHQRHHMNCPNKHDRRYKCRWPGCTYRSHRMLEVRKHETSWCFCGTAEWKEKNLERFALEEYVQWVARDGSVGEMAAARKAIYRKEMTTSQMEATRK